MLFNPQGMHIKNVVKIDEDNGKVTVEGFQFQQHTYDLGQLAIHNEAEGGLEEIRRFHRVYLEQMERAAVELKLWEVRLVGENLLHGQKIRVYVKRTFDCVAQAISFVKPFARIMGEYEVEVKANGMDDYNERFTV